MKSRTPTSAVQYSVSSALVTGASIAALLVSLASPVIANAFTARINQTAIKTISDLDTITNGLVERLMIRSEDDRTQAAPTVIAMIDHGRVRMIDDNHVQLRAYSKGVLQYMADTRMCDHDMFGDCLVFERTENDDKVVTRIGTQVQPDGSVAVSLGRFLVYGHGSNNDQGLVKRLDARVKDKSVIYTRATATF